MTFVQDFLISTIEMLVIIAVALYFIIRYNNKKRIKLWEDYDDTKNLSRKEQGRTETGFSPRERGVEETNIVVPRPDEPKRDELLPTTEPSVDGERSDRTGEDGKRTTKLGRLRKRFKVKK